MPPFITSEEFLVCLCGWSKRARECGGCVYLCKKMWTSTFSHCLGICLKNKKKRLKKKSQKIVIFCCMDTGQDPQTWTCAPSQIHYYIIRWLFWITTKLIHSFIWAMITIYFYWFWYFSLINEISWPESFRNLLQPHRLALSFQEATTAWKRGCPTPTVVRMCIVCVSLFKSDRGELGE